MKVIDILNARDSLVKLIKVRFTDFKTTSGVYKLAKKVDATFDMVQKEQDKIIDIYVEKDEKGNPVIQNGNYCFKSAENKDNFLSDITKLRNEEVQDIEKLQIKISSVQVATDISTEDMLKLDPVIDWVD